MRILVVGAGAVGLYFASRIAQGGAEVEVVSRGDYETAAKQGGFQVRSDRGEYFFAPKRLLHAPEEFEGVADCVILSCKYLPTVDRVALLDSCIRSERTVIMLIQNGIDIEPEIVRAFPKNQLLSTVAYIGGSRPAPGQVLQTGAERLEFGVYPRGISPEAEALAALWEKAGVRCTLTENVAEARWRKLLWNLAFNPVSVLAGGADTRQMCDGSELEQLCFDLMLETVATANACGIGLTRSDAERQLEYTRTFPAFRTSMLQDALAGRHVETEAILGNMVRLARLHGVPVPKAQACYALLRSCDKLKLGR